MKKLYLLSSIVALSLIVVACTPQAQKQATDVLIEDSTDVMEKDGDVMMEDDTSLDLGDEMQKSQPTEDVMMKKVNEADKQEMMAMTYQFSGQLKDVAGGSATGVVQASFDNNKYSLLATFDNLPNPQGTDFYEGWAVRKSPLDVISTGKAEKIDGKYMNVYSSGDNLTDHTFYVLTIEPDDGDPAPAGHILEGTLIKN